jgi:predicted  nucleic acid-binding Zn-ribbon protein
MKFKDKTKEGYPVRLVIPEIVNSNRCSVWAVTYLNKEEYFMYDTNGYVLGEDENNIFNLVPDTVSPTKDNETQDELYMEHIEARLCKLEDDQAIQQDDIDDINRELEERLDPNVVDVKHLKDDVEAINDDIGYLYKELAEVRVTASTQQSDINDINRELSDRLDPTIEDVDLLKDDHITLMDQVDQLSYLRKDFESLQTEVSEFRGEQNAMFTNLMDNNQDISGLKGQIAERERWSKAMEECFNYHIEKAYKKYTEFEEQLALHAKMLEQCIDVDKMGTELPDFAVMYEARYWVRDEDGCPILTDNYYTHSEVEDRYPTQVETMKVDTYRKRGPILEWQWEIEGKGQVAYTQHYYTQDEIEAKCRHNYGKTPWSARKLDHTQRRRT